jgi:hypothetical protein
LISVPCLDVLVFSPARMSYLVIRMLLLWCCWSGLSLSAGAAAAALSVPEEGGAGYMWARLLVDAERLQLPTKFLKALPSDFIHFEFDDLRTYAAEYHLGEHRMVLNRALSLNAAGRTLKPLGKMTHKELEVLYHELFHAYMDFLKAIEEPSGKTGQRSEELLQFAREQQVCRYGEVEIAPIIQRKNETETRYLTPAESWEALNETWAVFIGWVVWNQLEVPRKIGKSGIHERRYADQWMQRLKTAFENGELRGYYVPEDPDERRLAQKRYLAKSSQLTLEEAVVLMKQVLAFQYNFIDRLGTSSGAPRVSICPTSRIR